MLPGPANRSKKLCNYSWIFFQTDCGGIVMLDEVRRKNEAGIGFLVKAGFEVIEEKRMDDGAQMECSSRRRF